MFSINEFLSKITKVKASDVHLMMGKQPSLRVSGDMVRIDMPALTEDDVDNILQTVLHKDMHEQIKDEKDIDFKYECKDI